MKGGSKVIVEPHRHDGVFVAKGKEDALVTKNMVSGESVYGEKRIAVQVTFLFRFSLSVFASLDVIYLTLSFKKKNTFFFDWP